MIQTLPLDKLKQVTSQNLMLFVIMNNLGYKKWIERYLQECPGEIKDDNHTKRLNKVMLNVKSAVAELNEKQGN